MRKMVVLFGEGAAGKRRRVGKRFWEKGMRYGKRTEEGLVRACGNERWKGKVLVREW